MKEDSALVFSMTEEAMRHGFRAAFRTAERVFMAARPGPWREPPQGAIAAVPAR